MSEPSFSALHASGVQSFRIAELFWSYFYIAVAVFAIVSLALALAIGKARAPSDLPKRELPKPARAHRQRVIHAATLLTCITLVVMLYQSAATSRGLASLPTADAIRVNVKAHKWWWEFTYPASVAGTQFTTAYEMHLPVGRPVEIDLTSTDVIHSFWVPSLHGKRDAFPGRHSSLFIQANEVGRFEGQCAEFCGVQHANMRFAVVVESAQAFEAWAAHSLAPAPPPNDATKAQGLDVFLKSRCASCHTIGGTEALATAGPNLTHLASRRSIAMGTLPNTRGHLAGWIADPQSIKPGVAMPSTTLEPDDLRALLAYLESLR
jgi:cytochrome c oxidase subunit II